MKKRTIKDLFNIPNCLCYFRIILIPIFLHRYFLASCKEDYYLCAFILILSGLSDFLDGYIARHYHMVTDFGKVIDPIADKLTQFTVAVVLIYTYSWMWFLLGIIVIKDGMLALGGLYLYEKGAQVKGASWWGKISTAIFDIVPYTRFTDFNNYDYCLYYFNGIISRFICQTTSSNVLGV